LALFALGLLAGSTSCGGGGGGSPIPLFFEFEPNDAPEHANPVGPVGIGDHFRILGHVSSIGQDLFDGFALQAVEPCQVELALYADDPFADLDVCVYDPMLAAYAFCFASPFNPETGAFSIFGAGTDFHLVVSSFAGAASYELDVRVVPLSAGSFATAGGGERMARAGGEDPALEPARQAHLERYFRGQRAASAEAEEDELYEPGELIEVDGGGNLRRTPLWILRPRARESREEASAPHVKVPR
ncbi:MAG TPA: hypothetical protein VMS76_00200, partial [Planctomycetota bacterium]|nr:hypothetical protein [Planctomycetota bacterium]